MLRRRPVRHPSPASTRGNADPVEPGAADASVERNARGGWAWLAGGDAYVLRTVPSETPITPVITVGGTNGKGAEPRQKPEKPRPQKRVAVSRAKPVKKAGAKKLPRAAAARPRQAVQAKKAARKSGAKRSATPKR